MRKNVKWERRQLRVILLCFAAYMLVYTGRLNFSIASPLFQQAGILTKAEIGVLGSTFFFVYGGGRLLNGCIGDYVAPKPFLTGGLALSALCNLGMALLPETGFMYGLWALNGLFQSMLWSAALRNVSMACPEEKTAKRAAMILSGSVGVGSVVAIVLATIMAGRGLRQIFAVPGALMLVMSLLLLLFLPSQTMPAVTPKRHRLSCLRDPLLLRAILPAAFHGAIKENVTLWAPLLFMDRYGLDLSKAAFYVFLMPLATLAGRMLFPVWYGKICGHNERKTLIWAFLLCAVTTVPLLLGGAPAWLAALALALISVCTSMINGELVSVFPINFRESNQVSAVSGIMDCATYGGSALSSAAFGFAISAFGYGGMFVVWLGLCLVSVGLLLCERPAGKK